MLSQIQIRNFAIVEQLDLELQAGMTVLTGETGAGKSILIDALGLVLGDRADSGIVRHGTKRAEIGVTFQVDTNSGAAEWLEENELDDEGECHIRRTVSHEGRSKGYINGRPVPVAQLKALGEMLVDIHGQHAHQSLVKRDIQRQLLDEFANYPKLLKQVSSLADEWHTLHEEHQALRQAAADRDSRLELLRYQVEELDALALSADELPKLEEEHARLAHAGELIDVCQRHLDLLRDNDEQTLLSQLGTLLHEMSDQLSIDGNLSESFELLNSAQIQLQEGADELRRYTDRLELDPERLQYLDERLSTIHNLSRKHHVEPHQLPPLAQQLSDELANIEQADIRLDEIGAEIEALQNRYIKAAKQLTKSRSKTAKQLGKGVSTAMDELGMQGGIFEIALQSHESEKPSPHGMEQIDFLVTANPGQPPKPLSKVASGGELSRISLAIQVILADSAHIPTLIFDEVDTGIGGGVAETVGRKLRTLGEQRQVLCVTHLPQVASQGHQHLQVAKQSDGKQTATSILPLVEQARVDEVARMLGGLEITTQTLAHAEEMISQAG
ncbi:DNA repair protein RecN [Solemya pervernicosa gill symbiont]|uniref:DNA repair protein RecN n=2 Tax=Gammaproteobacteria incertae sedis TaxID=118884 RepID=A0A1T2L9H8_9GAMM|nr:DNA repair protein RecN [Candidatus Reidiella endopervernicosa]OOZ41753.1 DNA repair protein RecN [Solemya pervernicosa gill symbiont]QKQ26460.1 DNA repair protein RecN [Candidatus Reidiella endopervernicosa]